MPKVNLSKFICKELVYDYLTGKLEPMRREKFQEFMLADTDLKNKVEVQKHSLRYIGELKKVELSEEYLAHLSLQHGIDLGIDFDKEAVEETKLESPSIIEEVLEVEEKLSFWERYKEFSYVLRKSGEAFGLALVVFLIVKVLPNQFFQTDFWKMEQKTSVLEETKIPLSGKVETAKVDPNMPVVNKAKKESSSFQKIDEKAKLDSTKVVKSKIVEKVVTQNESTQTSKKSNAAATSFYLYRSIIQVSDLSGVTAEFLTYLQGVGATKAGKVKLGWEKPNATYFHFHVSEKEHDNIVAFLKSKGNFNLNKITHWRRTPKKQMRVIVEIRQKGI